MKPYDPRFLLALGLTIQLREAKPDKFLSQLFRTREILKAAIVERGAEYGLTRAIAKARDVIGLADLVINNCANDPLFFEKDNKAFEAFKALFIPTLDLFDSALSLDIEGLYIYVLEKKRGYSPDTLLWNIEDVFPEDDHAGLSEFARDNMQEAGACFAFHRHTACGYHMARAVEEVARRYYELVTGRSTKYKDQNDKWRYRPLAQIAEELQQIFDKMNDDDPGLLSLIVPTLRQFCRIYRTPLSHADPELKELEASEADIAFGHAVSGISTMLEDVRVGAPYLRIFAL